jgi:hypothetical protein
VGLRTGLDDVERIKILNNELSYIFILQMELPPE